MDVMINNMRQRSVFFAGYLLFLLVAGLLLLINGKAGSFLLLNTYHSSWLDYFFRWYTNLGDGLFAVLLSLFFFFILKLRKGGLILLIAYASTGILAQIIKRIVQSPRPKSFFYPQQLSFFMEDIIHSGNTSFPSGHTVTAFALATVLVMYAEKKWQQLLLLVLAILAGFSRIYLSQHFLTDVLGGSFIGVTGALLCVHWCRNIKEEKLVFKKRNNQ
jgi:membrane-associated phospholipid phosphatase